MQKSNFRIPVGLALTLVIGLIGFKDTGIFVNSFNARLNSGIEVSFSPNNRAEIIGEGKSKSTYLVESDGNQFYVPKDVLLKVDNGVSGYTVLKNTSIKDASGNVIRLLFLDEKLTFVENKGDHALVRSEDGIEGLVEKKDLDPSRIRNIVEGIAKEDLVLNNGTYTLNILSGDTVNVAWFEKDYFILFDQYKNKFNVPKDKISIYVDKEQVAENVLEAAKNANQQVEVAETAVQQNSAVSSTAAQLINKAESLLGSPYVYGDTGKVGYDCSGLVAAVYTGHTNVKLPRSSKDMAKVGTYVTENELQPGDLLYFTSGSSSTISHVAIYAGDGVMIHASNSQRGVVTDPIDGYYFQNNFSHARRVLN